MRHTRSHLALLVTFGAAFSVVSLACNDNPDVSGSNGAGSFLGDGDSGDGDLGDGDSGDGDSGDGDLSIGGAFGDGDSGDGDGDSCAESGADADLVPANLLFVVDKSGSMNCNPPEFDPSACAMPQKYDELEASKWEITEQALTGENGALQVLAGQVGVSAGLIAFPLDDFCEVPASGDLTVPISKLTNEHLAELTDGLTLTADGQTPLAGAAIRGLEALRQGVVAGDLTGDTYLVVMTDGAETCQEAALEDLLVYVKEANDDFGIRTYAIGAPGSEDSRALLSEIAFLGGTPRSDDCQMDPAAANESCHIDLTESTNFEADLGDEFRGITQATTQTCEYDVPSSALVDRSKVNVEYTPSGGEIELILQDEDASCDEAEGWQYSEDGSQIVLCGQACDDVLADPGAMVRVVFGCRETITVVR